VEKSLIAFAPYNPRRASGSNLGALAIIMNFSTLVYNILFRPPQLGNTPLPYILGQGSCDFPNDAGNFWWSAGAMLHTTLIYSFHSYFQIKVFIYYSNLA
jgi:hypothetical protein